MSGRRSAFVALLRGINVGAAGKGRRHVPMAPLRALAEELGWTDVRTYLQSGNLVFAASGTPAALAERLSAAIRDRFACDVPVVVRPARDIVQLADACPFAAAARARPKAVHFGVATGRLPSTLAAAVAPYCTAGEHVVVQGQVLWADYANGVARSKLTPAVLDRAAGSPVTLRNLHTLHAIAALLGAGDR